MTLYAHFRTPREVCYAVKSAGEAEFGRLTPRPWNKFEPDTTAWWLVPSSDWPAYRHGKFHFNWVDQEKSSIFLGIHIEKGLDPSVSAVYSSPKGLRHIMYDDWTWFQLVRDMEDGQMAQKVIGFAGRLPIPLELKIEGGYVQDPSHFDPYAPQFKWHQYLFEWAAASSRFVCRTEESFAQAFEALSRLKTIEDLASILLAFTSNAWLWVDFFLGIRFQIHDADSPEPPICAWNASDFWANVLGHLSPWLI